MTQTAPQPVTIIFHSENGPEVGGSDFYMGRLMDGLDPDRFRIALLCRPGYPLEMVTDSPQRVERMLHGPSLLPDAGLSPRDSDLGRNAAHLVYPRELPASRHLPARLWSRLPRGWRRDVGLWRDVFRVRRMLTDSGAMLFHSMDGGCQPAALGASLAGCRVVVSYCGPPRDDTRSLLGRWLDRRIARHTDAHVVKSQFAAKAWSGRLQIDESQFEVIPNGIDPRPFDRANGLEIRQQLGIPPQAIVVGMTGRLDHDKGASVLLQAMPSIIRAHRDVWLMLTGNGTLQDELRAEARRTGIEDRIRFLGFRRDLPQVTRAYDIAVVPSVVGETFGWVLLEAMAAGRPIVASNVGGIPEVVQDGEQGWLFSPGDSKQLAQRLLQLVQDQPLRLRMGEAGRRRVTAEFMQSHMVTRTLHLYERFLSGHKIASTPELNHQGGTVPC